jgi:hypothetical protein
MCVIAHPWLRYPTPLPLSHGPGSVIQRPMALSHAPDNVIPRLSWRYLAPLALSHAPVGVIPRPWRYPIPMFALSQLLLVLSYAPGVIQAAGGVIPRPWLRYPKPLALSLALTGSGGGIPQRGPAVGCC